MEQNKNSSKKACKRKKISDNIAPFPSEMPGVFLGKS
jgi:hypothetical protein